MNALPEGACKLYKFSTDNQTSFYIIPKYSVKYLNISNLYGSKTKKYNNFKLLDDCSS